MSYHVWSTAGFGFCVDDIATTPDKVLKFAAMNEQTLSDLREYLDSVYEDGYTDDELEMESFDDFEGNFGMGLSTIISEVIEEEIPIVYADDFEGQQFILYCPSYPWNLQDGEKDLTEDGVREIFSKYISILTDQQIAITYYFVENGG